eukprot:1088449-Pelagomonas_calceolata.AAC.3
MAVENSKPGRFKGVRIEVLHAARQWGSAEVVRFLGAAGGSIKPRASPLHTFIKCALHFHGKGTHLETYSHHAHTRPVLPPALLSHRVAGDHGGLEWWMLLGCWPHTTKLTFPEMAPLIKDTATYYQDRV